MDAVRIEGAGPRFIARVWGTPSKRQRSTLVRDDGWTMLPADYCIEIEFAQSGEGSNRVHGRVIRIDGLEMVIDGHIARHPMKVWSMP